MPATPPIALEGVSKSFGNVNAVRELSLAVPESAVYGFLGPNGAGKSTTIRLLLGLQRPTDGAIFLFGHRVGPGARHLLRRVGALVESPSLYPHLTGRENLEVHRLLLDLPAQAIDEALATVRLSDAADRLVRKYSSGMKQRLGIAQALLGNPELLLLDEPTNALDPAGIHEVRSLIRELPQRCGTTVFLSSHLLAEVEQTATHVAILAGGRRVFEGSTAALLAMSRTSIMVDVDDPDGATQILARRGVEVVRTGSSLECRTVSLTAAEVNRLLVEAGVGVERLITSRPSLEEVFLGLTRSTDRAVVPIA